MRPKIILFSTLSPYPFWAGSEKYWFDLVTDPRARHDFEFHISLADSPVTRNKGRLLEAAGASVRFYRHYNVEFLRRNIARVRDRLTGKRIRTLPWYDEIASGRFDLVWFNVDGLHNLGDVEYGVAICKEKNIPYWLMLQHAYEDFFPGSQDAVEKYTDVVTSARRVVFIAERNRRSLERAIGRRLDNAVHSQNALPAETIASASTVGESSPVGADQTVRFFSLGRFSPKDKGQHLLLEALSGPDWKIRDWRLSFVGVSGSDALFVQRLAKHFQIDDSRIDIVPFRDDVFDEIAKHDVLLMPSLAEGTPFAMIESMACGRPALGTPIGGIPELISEGKTGWLARTIDVADVSDALERMWNDRARWREIGDAARQHVTEHNNQQKVFAEILDLLKADTDA